MRRNRETPLSVILALETLEREDYINYLEAENERLKDYEQKYNDLVMDNIRSSDELMGNLITAALSGVFDNEGERSASINGTGEEE